MEAVSTTAIWPATMLNRSDVELNSAGGQGGGIFEETGGVTLDRSLERLSKPLREGIEADEGTAEGEEGVMDVRPALIADGQPPEAVEPGQRALDDPAVPTEALAGVDALAGDT